MCLAKLFGKKKQEVQPTNPSDVEVVPHSDPRVAKSNLGRGLVVRWEPDDHPNHYIVYYENGTKTYPGVAQPITDFLHNGIDETLNTKRLRLVTTALNRGRDLSGFTEQEIFEGKVWLGKIKIE